MLDQIKAHLLDSINDIVSTANQFVLHPEKDFSRKSQLTMKTMIQAILTMGGNTYLKSYLTYIYQLPNLPLSNDDIRSNIKLLKPCLPILLLKFQSLTTFLS